jgi:hypothetical protein
MTSKIQNTNVQIDHLYDDTIKITSTEWAVSVVTGGKVTNRLNDFIMLQGIDENGQSRLWRGYLRNENKGSYISEKIVACVEYDDLSKAFNEDPTKLNNFYEIQPYHLTTRVTAEIGHEILKVIEQDKNDKKEYSIVEVKNKLTISISGEDKTESYPCWADWVVRRAKVPDAEDDPAWTRINNIDIKQKSSFCLIQ